MATDGVPADSGCSLPAAGSYPGTRQSGFTAVDGRVTGGIVSGREPRADRTGRMAHEETRQKALSVAHRVCKQSHRSYGLQQDMSAKPDPVEVFGAIPGANAIETSPVPEFRQARNAFQAVIFAHGMTTNKPAAFVGEETERRAPDGEQLQQPFQCWITCKYDRGQGQVG